MQCDCSNRTSAGRKKNHYNGTAKKYFRLLKHLNFQSFFPLFFQFCTRSQPKQRSTVLPPRTQMGNPVVPEVLPEDPETRALHRQHWQSIRTEEATGNPIQERYNFTLHEMTASTFPEMVQTADHSFQDQPVFWFYLTEHRDWSVAVLPF